jgi:hypothetical protein
MTDAPRLETGQVFTTAVFGVVTAIASGDFRYLGTAVGRKIAKTSGESAKSG